MTMQQALSKIDERLDMAMVDLMFVKPRSAAQVQRLREARREIIECRNLIEATLSGPRVSRSRRIAKEVALTGMEQELWG